MPAEATTLNGAPALPDRPGPGELLGAFRTGSPGGAWSRATLVLGAGAGSAAVAALALEGSTRVVSWQIALILAPLAAAAACMGARRAASSTGRATWQILAIGALLATMSQLVYARVEVLELAAPFPSMGFHLLVAFHLALAEGAILALRPAHEPRTAAEIALDGALILLAASAITLRVVLDRPLADGFLDSPQVVAVLIGQLAVSASLLFTTLLVVWRDTALSGPAVDSLLVAAVFFAFGDLLLALGLEAEAGAGDLASGFVRLMGWLALTLSAALATLRPRGTETSGRRELVTRRARQVVIPAVPLFMVVWALDAARRNDVSTASLVVIALMGVFLTARIGAALYAVEDEMSERRAAEERAAQARLRAVTAQMNPHFLFNALHSLSALVRRDIEASEGALQRLGTLLRYGLDAGDHPVSLREEWGFARNYLDLETLRLGPRLEITADVPEGLQHLAVPPFILQPLVENSVKHAVTPFPDGGRVAVSARVEDGRLILEVSDSGPGADAYDLTHAQGVGIRGVRAQLESHAPGAWSMTADRAPSGDFRIRVSLPVDED